MNHTTRRHPRTLQDAFGPYCTPYISEAERRADYTAGWWAAMIFIAICTLLLIGVTL